MTVYTCQYWNERSSEWRDAGVRSTDLDVVRARQFDMIKQCDGCVRFRLVATIPG